MVLHRASRIRALSRDCSSMTYLADLLSQASEIDWPEQLRFISISRRRTDDFKEVALRVATFIPSVRVIKIRGAFFTVAKRNARRYNRIIIEKWWASDMEVPRSDF